MHEKAISVSVEMYLVTIFRLTETSERASTHDIAKQLHVSLPSVTGQLKKLTARGYVDYLWREGACLTVSGREVALNVLRKNRLIKTFLHTRAKYALHELFQEACFMEHVVSDRFANALEEMLNWPVFDPHGLPIPDRNGSMTSTDGVPLGDISPPCRFETVHVDEMCPETQSHLDNVGLYPRHTAVFQGRETNGFRVLLDTDEVLLPPSVGKHLIVRVVS